MLAGSGSPLLHSATTATGSTANGSDTIADPGSHPAATDHLAPEDPGRTENDSKTPFFGGVSTYRFWLIFGEILATQFIANFDGTIMASSHPAITSYFNSSNSASWLSTAFLLTSSAFQPLLGRLSDTVGESHLT